jgi:hypothetical protein
MPRKYQVLTGKTAGLETQLNEQGALGWKLCSLTPSGAKDSWIIVMVKEVPIAMDRYGEVNG